MAKYKQIYYFDNEDSFGENEIQFIITDNIDLITDETEATEIDILLFNKLKFAFQGENGGLIQDELDFFTADHLVKNSDEQDCLNLINSALTEKIYIAVFFNPQSPLVKEDVIYVGAIDPDIKSEASKWDRDEFSNTAEVSYSYKYVLTPIVEAKFDEILMKDISEEISLDSTWITSNVDDRQAWRKDISRTEGSLHSDLSFFHCDLVNLNKLLRKVGDEAITIFNTINSSSYTLNFANRVKLTGKYAPARWNKMSDPKVWISDSNEKSNINHFSEKWQDLKMYHNLDDATDYREYYIDPDEIETFSEEDSLWVDAKYFIDLDNDSEYSETTAKTYRIGGNNETFADFLYAFAANFDLLLLLEIDVVNEEINITFANSDYLNESETIYFKDADKYKKNKSIKVSEDKTPFYSESFYGVGDSTFGKLEEHNGGVIYGKDSKGVRIPDTTARPLTKEEVESNTSQKHKKLMFTISPTVARMMTSKKDGEEGEGGWVIPTYWYTTPYSFRNYIDFGVLLPHNLKIQHRYRNPGNDYYSDMKDEEKVGWAFATRSLHTGLYVKVPSVETYEPTNYFTPIRAMAVKIDGEERLFDTLEAFLNVARLRFNRFTRQDIELSLPYWNAFSTSSDGSNPSLKNLKLGKKITINSEDFIINDIDIDFSTPQVNLKLKQEKLYSDIKNPTSPKTSGSLLGSGEEIITIDKYPKRYVVGPTEPLSALCLSSDGDGTVKTITTADEANRFFGLALESKEDDYVQVLKAPGEYYIEDLAYSFGDELYLRADGTTTNIDTSPANTYHSATDCVYMLIGRVIEANTIELERNEPIEFSETNF